MHISALQNSRNKPLIRLIIETAVWLLIAVLAWIFSYNFAGKDMLFRWGADLWPRAVAIFIALGAIGKFVTKYRALVRTAPASVEAEKGDRKESHDALTKLKIVATFAVPLLYIFLLPRAGYYLTTPLFFAGLMYLLGIRRVKHLIGTNLCIYAVLLLVFSKLLFVPMPTGYWPGFYHISNWFLSIIE